MLFVLTLELSNLERINLEEALFMVFALGFSLEKLAAIQEHGIKGGVLRLLLSGGNELKLSPSLCQWNLEWI